MKSTLLSILLAVVGLPAAKAVTLDLVYYHPNNHILLADWSHTPGSPSSASVSVDGYGTFTVSVLESRIETLFQPTGLPEKTLIDPINQWYGHQSYDLYIGDELWHYQTQYDTRNSQLLRGHFRHHHAPETGSGAALLGLGLAGIAGLRRRLAR